MQYCNIGLHTDHTLGKSSIQFKDIKKIQFESPIAIVDNGTISQSIKLLNLDKNNILATELYIISDYQEKRYPREIIRFYAFDMLAYKSMCQMIDIAQKNKHYVPRIQINDLILQGDFAIIVDQDFLFLDNLPYDKTYIAINADTNLTDPNLIKYNTIFYYDSYALKQDDLRKIEILSARNFKHEKQVWYYNDQHYNTALLFPDSIKNYNKLIDKANSFIKFDNKYPVFSNNADELFDALVDAGFQRKCPQIKEYIDRLEYEKSVIKKAGYSSYFLVNNDFIYWARKQNIPIGPGRGSAAGSLVSYCLDITKLDPIKYGLYFERFLNPERVSPPDIDIDCSTENRNLILKYFKERYGYDRVTQIITYTGLKAKSALKDAARLNEISAEEINRVTSWFPPAKFGTTPTLEESIKVDIIKEWAFEHQHIWNEAKDLEGFIRQVGVHAAGVIIAPSPINEITGISYAEGNKVCQLDKFDSEKLGLLKLDLLGVQTLDLLQNAQNLLGKSYYDLMDIPFDDSKTFEGFASGNTLGCFQFESNGMRALLKQVKPSCLSDLAACNALFRPGPLTAGLTSQYITNKSSDNPEYFLPEFETLLSQTHGILVFQEDVMLISQKIAGFSLSRADNLRKAIGKKDKNLMDSMSKEFIQGCMNNGYESKKANRLWEIIVGFSDYAFNKSHSICYSAIAYWCMYLKVNHPKEFAVSLLSLHMGDNAKSHAILLALKDKINLLPPTINEAQNIFSLHKDGVMFGYTAIKGMGNAAKSLVENGPYSSVIDVIMKNKLDTSQITSLIYAGAFDKMDARKDVLLGNVERMIKYAKANNDSEIFNLFDPTESFSLNENKAIKLPTERFMEKECFGFNIFHGFMGQYSWLIKCLSPNIVIGNVIEIKRTKTKAKQEDMAILTIETLDGQMKAILFPQIYDKFNIQLAKDETYAFKGELRQDKDDSEVASILVKDLATEPAICVTQAWCASHEKIDKSILNEIKKSKPKTGMCTISFFRKGFEDELIKEFFYEEEIFYTKEIHEILLKHNLEIQLDIF